MITYEIKEHIGVLEETAGGWRLELNRVSWNGNPDKLDLRNWSPDHTKMGKGITLTPEAAQTLKELLNTI